MDQRIPFPPEVEARAAAFGRRFQLRRSEVSVAARIVFLASCGSGYDWLLQMGRRMVLGEQPDLRRRIVLLLQSIMPEPLAEKRVLFSLNLDPQLGSVTFKEFKAALATLTRAGWVGRGPEGCALSRKALAALASGRGIDL